MHNSQLIATRIEGLAIERGLTIKQLLLDSDAGKNTVQKLKQGKEVYVSTLSRIAEQLRCSVDYLLGNTDIVDPERELRAILQMDAEQPLNERDLRILSLARQIPDEKVDAYLRLMLQDVPPSE